MEQTWGAFGSPRVELDVGSYRQGVGAWYPPAGRDQRGRHAIITGGRNARPGGRRGRGNHGRGGCGRAKFGFQAQCWPLQEAVAAAPAPANPRPELPCPAPTTSAPTPTPAPMPTPTPSTLLPPAAPAAAFSSNKAAAAALRAQKHKHPTTVTGPAAATTVKADHHMDAQPPNPAPAANTSPMSPATPLSQHVKNTGSTHQKAGSKTQPTPQRKGSWHKGGQLNHKSFALPPVGDPVEHQAFLSAPSKRQARKARQQSSAAANFGMPQDITESGQPADFKPQLGNCFIFSTPEASRSPFGSPYTPPSEFGSPSMPPHPPCHLSPPMQAPTGVVPPYNWIEEEGTQPGHEALDEQALPNQHGPQPRAPQTMSANCRGASKSDPPFSPVVPPSFSANAGDNFDMSHYDQYHASGSSIGKSAAAAGKRRKSACLYQNAPRGHHRNSPAPQPAYTPSGPPPYVPPSPRAYVPPSICTYAPYSPGADTPSGFSDYSPHAVPADFTKHGGGPLAGHQLLAVGPNAQGSPQLQAAPGNHFEQGEPGVSEKRLQWALSRLASLEGRVLRLEASAATC